MTSIAAFLVHLAGGTSKSQSAAPANPSGGGEGLFAALLEATGAALGSIEGITKPLDPLGKLDPSGVLIAAADGQTRPETAFGDAALRQALTEGLGLPRGGAEIDAAIIENPVNTKLGNLLPAGSDSAVSAVSTLAPPMVLLLSKVQTDTGSPNSTPAPQSNAAPVVSLPPKVQTDTGSPASTPAPVVSLLPKVQSDTGSPASTPAPQSDVAAVRSQPHAAQPVTSGPASEVVQKAFTQPDQALRVSPPTPQSSSQATAAPVPGQHSPQPAPENEAGLKIGPQNNGRAADAPEAPRATGLENALNQASQTGRDNGLEKTALSRATQPPSRGEAPQTSLAQGDDAASAKRATPSGVTKSENPLTVKPETGRAEFASRGAKIFQQLVKPESGQTLIHFKQSIGGETNNISSPPMLTVSVQAQAASPGPASANAPHVPVSALAVHIAQQANNGARKFTIRLDPPELGRIEVHLDISRKGQVMTHLVVERSETLELLQRDARQLERALQNAGLDTSDEGTKFSLKDQGLARGGEQHGQAEDGSGASTNGGDDDPGVTPGDTMPPATRYIASTRLDIRI